ncbi:hypothetical protein QTP70_019351 [Hemibagrus guttatus]|uniref:Integrase catalytic domain-containing protein n=1 Tax=Hemibagrus guttatus TaxID=175788 RepID=A0AAE0QGN5_9TELE|nr:hypothetical protein QTP70_019351 [Hemibagrus guttatus]KAK3552962.1 hypothetical protein QTP86_029632 [Hemibagrus guttatus]
MKNSKADALSQWHNPANAPAQSEPILPPSVVEPDTAWTSRQLPTGLLEPWPIPHRPWSHMAVDFITDFPSSSGFNMILVATNQFSKACQLVPLKGLPTAMDMAMTLFNQVFRTYGLPEDIVSDSGSQFTSLVLESILDSPGNQY